MSEDTEEETPVVCPYCNVGHLYMDITVYTQVPVISIDINGCTEGGEIDLKKNFYDISDASSEIRCSNHRCEKNGEDLDEEELGELLNPADEDDEDYEEPLELVKNQLDLFEGESIIE